MLHVLIVHDGEGGLRGAERVVLDLVGGFPPGAARFSLLTCQEALAAAFRVRGLEATCAPFPAPPGEASVAAALSGAVRQAALLVRMLRRGGVDLVHVNNGGASLWAALAGWWCGVPVIAHLHSSLSARTRFRLGIDLADRIVTVSRSVAAVSTALPEVAPRVRVIHNGVIAGPARLGADDPARAAARAGLGLGAGQVAVATVGLLNAAKRIDVAIAAQGQLQAASPGRFVLLVIGDGPERAALERQAAGLDVLFLGWRDDVPALLREVADLYVLPSETEAFNLTLLEAAAAGLPRVATAVGGNGESVRDGEDGFLVPVGDPAALAVAIARLADEPGLAAAFGEAGRRRVLEAFTPERFVDAFRALYVEVAAERRGRAGRIATAVRVVVGHLRRRRAARAAARLQLGQP